MLEYAVDGVVVCLGRHRTHLVQDLVDARCPPFGVGAQRQQQNAFVRCRHGRVGAVRHGDNNALRSGDAEALQIGNADIAQHRQLLLRLHAFGNQCAAAGIGDFVHGAHEVQLERIGVDAGDKVAVDLDELGPYLGPHAQIGKAFAHVVHGDLDTYPAEVLEGFLQIGEIRHRLVFSKFDDDSRRRYAEAKQILANRDEAFATGVQAADAHVQEESQRAMLFGELNDGSFHRQPFEFVRAFGCGCRCEQRARCVQFGTLRAANQRFAREIASAADVENGLIDGMQAAIIHQAPQQFTVRVCLRGGIVDWMEHVHDVFTSREIWPMSIGLPERHW